MAHISIYRHGKVQMGSGKWIAAKDVKAAIHAYNTASISEPDAPDINTAVTYVVCSDLRRSTDTALNIFGTVNLSDPLFRKAGLPAVPVPFIRLPVTVWFALVRLFWIMGYSGDQDTVTEFKARAKLAADRLVKLAEQHRHIAFIGHGIINRKIAKELKNQGFSGPKTPSSEHGSCSRYTR